MNRNRPRQSSLVEMETLKPFPRGGGSSSTSSSPARHSDDGNDMSHDHPEDISLVGGETLAIDNSFRNYAGADDDDDDNYQTAEDRAAASPYSFLYIAAGVVLVIMFGAVIFVPSNSNSSSRKRHAKKCATHYLGTISTWHDLLAEVNLLKGDDRCTDMIVSSRSSSTGGETCKCQNSVKPSEPLSYKDKWQVGFEANKQLVEQESRFKLDVVLLGDSITELWRGTSMGKPLDSLQENMAVYQDLFDSTNSPVQGLALGISGDRCQNVLYRLQNGEMADTLRPTVWWLLIGANDLGFDYCSVDSVVAGNIRIVDEILASRPHSWVVINSVLPAGNATQLQNWDGYYSEVNDRLDCYAAGKDSVEFFNATSIFVTSENTVDETRLPDGLHPGAVGYRLWGEAIVRKVKELSKQHARGH